MRRKGYKDIILSYDNWKKIMQIKLDSKNKSADATITRILEVYYAAKTAYKRAPKTIEVLSRINDKWVSQEEQESDTILKGWESDKK